MSEYLKIDLDRYIKMHNELLDLFNQTDDNEIKNAYRIEIQRVYGRIKEIENMIAGLKDGRV